MFRALTCLVLLLGMTETMLGSALGQTSFPNLAALRANRAQLGQAVLLGYGKANDGGGGLFVPSSGLMAPSCDNGGTVVADVAGHCWARDYAGALDIRWFGANGNGDPRDGAANSAALQQAFAVCHSNGGGSVFVPPTGHAFHLENQVNPTGNGCGLIGVGLPNWPGPGGKEADWTNAGSWIACDTSSTPCIRFSGSGLVDGIDFWQTQPDPSEKPGLDWTPCGLPGATYPVGTPCGPAIAKNAEVSRYPWILQFTQNFSTARHIQLANVTYGIAFEYPVDGNVTGTYSGLEHIWAGCFAICLRFRSVNDTIHLTDIHIRDLWNINNPNVVRFMEKTLVGWDVEYLDNATAEGIEFYKVHQAIYLADATAHYGTSLLSHAAENLQLTNVAFNQVCQAIAVQNGATQVSAALTNVIGQTDTDTNCAADSFFDLASDNADVTFGSLRISTVGRGFMTLGAGHLHGGGRARIDGLLLSSPLQNGGTPDDGYGYLLDGTRWPAFTLARGSVLTVPTGLQDVKSAAGAGPLAACAGTSRKIGSNCGTIIAPLLTSRSAGSSIKGR